MKCTVKSSVYETSSGRSFIYMSTKLLWWIICSERFTTPIISLVQREFSSSLNWSHWRNNLKCSYMNAIAVLAYLMILLYVIIWKCLTKANYVEDYFYQGLLHSVLYLLFKRLRRVIISLLLPYLLIILYIIFIKNYTL